MDQLGGEPSLSPDRDRRGRTVRLGRHGVPLLGHALLTVAVLWPAVRHFTTRAAIDSVDGAMFSWLWGVMPDSLAAGRSPYRTDLVFHPVGSDLELTTSSPLIGFATWPIRALFGVAAQVNAFQLGAMFFTAAVTYLLVVRLCDDRAAAWIAGAAYAICPSRWVHVDAHLNLVLSGVIPLGLLMLIRVVERPSSGRVVALGATVGATFLVDPQLTIMQLLGMGAWSFSHRHQLRPLVGRLLQAGLAALVVAAPLVVPMGVAIARGGIGDPDPTASTLQYSSSPLSWFVPPTERLWVGQIADIEPLTPNWEGVAYPGLILLGLAFVGSSLASRERRRGWVAVFWVGFVLSLGPYPYVRNTSLDIPLPFWLMRAVPGLDAMRVPGRISMLGALGLYVLAALALADLARRWPRRAPLALAAVGVLSLVEIYPREVITRDDEVPAAYEVLAARDDDDVVLEIPLKWSTTQEQYGFEGTDQDFRFLLYQLEHGHPIVSGAVSRYPEADLDALLAEPVYRQVLSLAGQPDFDDPATFDAADLHDLDIGYVAYHRDDPVPEVLRYLRGLDLELLADDGETIIWRVAGG